HGSGIPETVSTNRTGPRYGAGVRDQPTGGVTMSFSVGECVKLKRNAAGAPKGSEGTITYASQGMITVSIRKGPDCNTLVTALPPLPESDFEQPCRCNG